jgi:carboxylesterase
MKRGPVGCLLLHGYTDGPASMRILGERLAEAGVTVRCDLLPGHGTQPENLNSCTWRDWWNAALAGFGALERECSAVFVAGLSFGGTLALHLATHRNLSGLITLGGMLGTVSPWGPWAGVMRHFWPVVKKADGSDICCPAAKARHIAYNSVPMGGLAQAFELVCHVKEDLQQIQCPVLVAHGAHDHTIPLASAHQIMNGVSSTQRRLLVLPRSYHVITVDLDHEELESEILRFIRDWSPETGVRSS